MKVIIEETTEKDYPKKVKDKRRTTEIPTSILWEHPEHVFTPEDEIPPEQWDFQKHKVKL